MVFASFCGVAFFRAVLDAFVAVLLPLTSYRIGGAKFYGPLLSVDTSERLKR